MYDSPRSYSSLTTFMLVAAAACSADPAPPSSDASTSSGADSSDASTTDDLASTSSTGAETTGSGSSSDTTGSETGPGTEALECFDASTLVVRPGAFSDPDAWSYLNETSCVLEAQEWSRDDLGRERTDITVFCDADNGETDTDTDAGTDTDTGTGGTTGGEPNPTMLDISIIGATIDLGTEAVEVSFYYSLDRDHMFGSEATYQFTVRRGDQLLLLGDDELSELGATAITGDTVCTYHGNDCGFPVGIEGVGPDGETLQVLTGEPTEFLVDGQPMLVAAAGISPQDCPDGTEPYDPNTQMGVFAVHTALLVRD